MGKDRKKKKNENAGKRTKDVLPEHGLVRSQQRALFPSQNEGDDFPRGHAKSQSSQSSDSSKRVAPVLPSALFGRPSTAKKQEVGWSAPGGGKRERETAAKHEISEEKRVVEGLSIKKLAVGQQFLGVVREVLDLELRIALPFQLTGVVTAARVSSLLTESLREGIEIAKSDDAEIEPEFSLRDFYAVGMFLPVVILKIQADEGAADSGKRSGTQRRGHRIELSMNPELVNGSLVGSNVKAQQHIAGIVASQEDNGWVVHLGVDEMTGYIPLKSVGSAKLRVGIVRYFAIDGLVGSRAATLSLLPRDERKIPVTGPSEREFSFDSLIPGNQVRVRVLSIDRLKGVVCSLPGSGDVRAFIHHLHAPEEVNVKERLVVRVIFVDPQAKNVYVSLLGPILELSARQERLKLRGETVDDALIASVDPVVGLEMNSPGVGRLHAHVSRLIEGHISASAITKKFVVGEDAPRCRVLQYHMMDDILSCSLQESVLEAEVLSLEDAEVGMSLTARVETILPSGVAVSVSVEANVWGFVPLLHLADVPLKHPPATLRPGKLLPCRVLVVDQERRKLLLTAKKRMVSLEERSQRICSYREARPGLVTWGVVTGVKDHGVLVTFFNNVVGLVPLAHCGAGFATRSHVAERFHVGQVLRCRVLTCDPDVSSLRLSLRIKDSVSVGPDVPKLNPNLHFDELCAGQVVPVVVSEVSPRGVRVLLTQFLQGFVAPAQVADIAELAPRVLNALSPGMRLEAVVLSKEARSRQTLLSLKYSLVSAASIEDLPNKFEALEVGMIMFGWVKKIASFGAFVSFPSIDVAALCPRAEVADAFVDDVGVVLAPGQTVVAKVMTVDPDHRQFTVSLKESDLSAGGDSFSGGSRGLWMLRSFFFETSVIVGDALGTAPGERMRATVRETACESGTLLDLEGCASTEGKSVEGLLLERSGEEAKKIKKGRTLNVTVMDVSVCSPSSNEVGNKDKNQEDGLVIRCICSASPRHAKPLVSAGSFARGPTEGDELSATVEVVTPWYLVCWWRASSSSGETGAGGGVVFCPVVGRHAPKGRGRKDSCPSPGADVLVRIVDVSSSVDRCLGELVDRSSSTPSGGVKMSSRKKSTKEAENEVTISSAREYAKKGSWLNGVVTDCTAAAVTVRLGSHCHGRVYAMDASDDVATCASLVAHFAVSSAVRVRVLDVDKANVYLSMREPVSVREGAVVGVRLFQFAPLYALVQLPERHGVGRVHVCDSSDVFRRKPWGGFAVGSVVAGKIMTMSETGGTIDVSLRQSDLGNEERSDLALEDISHGQHFAGYVRNVTEKGVFVSLSRSLHGRVKPSMVFDEKDPRASSASSLMAAVNDTVVVGQRVRCVVSSVNSKKKLIELSMKPRHVGEEDMSDEDNQDEEMAEIKEGDAEGGSGETEVSLESGDDEDGDVISEGGEEDNADSDSSSSSGDQMDEGKDIEERRADKKDSRRKRKHAETLPVGEEEMHEFFTAQRKRTATMTSQSSIARETEESDSDAGTSVGVAVATRRKERGVERIEELLRHEALGGESQRLNSVDDFERELVGDPDSSYLWIRYIAFHLALSETDRAREVAERAIQRIHYRKEMEKLNVWIALLRLEYSYGTQQTLQTCFLRAIKQNDSKRVHSALAKLYETEDELEKTNGVFDSMLRLFREDWEVWKQVVSHSLRTEQSERAQKILARSVHVLAKRDQLKLLEHAAIEEFRCGNAERGRTIFESLISAHPKRSDLWSVFISMEERHGSLDAARQLLRRVVSLSLSLKAMKSMFKRYLAFETENGTDESIEGVKQLAREWVDRLETSTV